MKKTLWMLPLLISPTLAMAAPDFNGTWVRNNAGSDPDPYPLYWITRQTQSTGGGGNAEVLMTVHQDGNSLQVTDPQHPMHVYTLDGKAHTRITDTEMEKSEDTATMQGDTLVINTTMPYGGMPGNVTLKEKEVWSLSADGKVLTITITRDIPAKQKTIKEVFNRTEGATGALCSAGCVVLH